MKAIKKPNNVKWLVTVYWLVVCVSLHFLSPVARAEEAQVPPPPAEDEIEDPFKPKVMAPPTPYTGPAPMQQEEQIIVVLEGISMGPRGAFAVINGQLYAEGQVQGGIKVLQIRKGEVDILVNGVERTERLLPIGMSGGSKNPTKFSNKTPEPNAQSQHKLGNLLQEFATDDDFLDDKAI